MSYDIVYKDMVSEDFIVLTQTPLVPLVGDRVNLCGECGKVFLVEHVYKKNKDEIIVLDYLNVILDWDIN